VNALREQYSQTPRLQTAYRPEVDGLRALAVTAVILHHFDKDILPSGYLGVDIFFVISGYVIASSLYEKQRETFREFFISFAARRIKRLAPALVVCTLASSILVWLFVPSPNESLLTGISALIGLSNLYLYFQNLDYFSPSRDLNAFTQTWSLGVEEQFYLFFPVIFWATGFARKSDGRFNFIVIVSLLSAASLCACLFFTKTDPQAAYFLMPLRFWELGVGTILFALSKPSQQTVSDSIGYWLTCAASVLLVGVLFAPLSYYIFSVIAVVFLTTIVIAFIKPTQLVGAILSHRAVVYIGLISYPLYLWHWSVISLSRWTIGLHFWTIPFQLAAIVLLSVCTFEYVEKPLRRAEWLRISWRAIVVWISCYACCGILVFGLMRTGGFLGVDSARRSNEKRHPPPAFIPLKGSGLNYDNCVVDSGKRVLRENTFDLCTVPPKRPGGQMIWSLGDSHAGHLQGLLYAVHDQIGIGVHLIETPGVSFPMISARQFEPRKIIFQKITENLRPNDIVLVSRLFLKRDGSFKPLDDLLEWTNSLIELAKELSARKVSLVVAGPPPIFLFDAVNSCWFRVFGFSTCDIGRSVIAKNVDSVLKILRDASRESGNIFIFDQFSVLCPAANLRCSPFEGGELFFRDKDHLNVRGAASLAPNFIGFLRENNLLR
jgi:peptidoglycan/LPS O-acetylase OafA/YrhL